MCVFQGLIVINAPQYTQANFQLLPDPLHPLNPLLVLGGF